MHQSILALPFLLALGVHSVRAQQPTSEQRDAIRAACCSDFIANCAGVEPGGKEALACLMRSHDNLSAPCKTAVDAVATKPEAPAAAAPPPVAPPSQTAAPSPPAEKPAPTTSQDELNAVRGACTPNESIVLDCTVASRNRGLFAGQPRRPIARLLRYGERSSASKRCRIRWRTGPKMREKLRHPEQRQPRRPA